MSIIIIFIFKKSGSGGPVELLIDLVSPNTGTCASKWAREDFVFQIFFFSVRKEIEKACAVCINR